MRWREIVFPSVVWKEHIVLGCLNREALPLVCPPHHVGYVLRSWIPSLLTELEWLHCLQNKDNFFQAWRSELLQMIPSVHQQFRLISQCVDSCIPLFVKPSHLGSSGKLAIVSSVVAIIHTFIIALVSHIVSTGVYLSISPLI